MTNRSKLQRLSADELAAVSGGTQQNETVQVFSYAVQTGDTLSTIASRYNTTVEEIQKYNKWIKNPDQIEAGSILMIPYKQG